MVRRPDRTRPGQVGWLALVVALAALAPGPAPALVPALPSASAEAGIAAAVPGLPDLLHGRTVLFTRRLGADTVAFEFTPREVTSRGRLVGDLAYHGPTASGSVTGAIAEARLTGEGSCGRVTLRFEPVTLAGSSRPTSIEPVAVDLTRASSGLGRVAGTLCSSVAELGGWLRRLEAALEGLGGK